jgi:ribosomal protein L11 methyltransferase
MEPYSDLYIYHIKGRLKRDAPAVFEDFIGNWEEEDFSFLFFSRPAETAVRRLLSDQRQLSLVDAYQMPYHEWLGERPRTFSIGQFLVVPPWECHLCGAAQTGGRRLLLDPGVVFGTGTHPTTRDCLAALEQVFAVRSPESVLDLGTGTGLLALAAAILGSRRTIAADINFLSAQTARRNICLNRLEDRVLAVQARAEDVIAFPAELLVANIHWEVMHRLIASEGFLGKKCFILSGLLRSQFRDAVERLAHRPVRIERTWERDGTWYTLLGTINER